MIPLASGPALGSTDYADLCRRMIFESCKWDLQFIDTPVLAKYPLILPPSEWNTLARLAERLAEEVLAAERELVARPELHGVLALPGRIGRALQAIADQPLDGWDRAPRYIRFDFHPTAEGWRISEANTDVPGGLLEGSALGRLMADVHGAVDVPGDPTAALAESLTASPGIRRLALVHATAYTDDRQVMVQLQRALTERGVEAELVSPAQVRRDAGRVLLQGEWLDGPRPAEGLFRFFPAEWLANLPRQSDWRLFFDPQISQCNPATALLTQSKRFPLLWDRLQTPLPTWRALLPETRDPRNAPWRTGDAWLIKAALGRVGEEVGLRGVTRERPWRQMIRSARLFPRHWVAQRRFPALPIETPDGPRYPCLGVFVVANGASREGPAECRLALRHQTPPHPVCRAAGIYGRLAERPLIDSRAQDVAVLVARPAQSGAGLQEVSRHVA